MGSAPQNFRCICQYSANNLYSLYKAICSLSSSSSRQRIVLVVCKRKSIYRHVFIQCNCGMLLRSSEQIRSSATIQIDIHLEALLLPSLVFCISLLCSLYGGCVKIDFLIARALDNHTCVRNGYIKGRHDTTLQRNGYGYCNCDNCHPGS